MLLERQFRYALSDVLTEIPAGKLDYIGEDPHEAAQMCIRDRCPLCRMLRAFGVSILDVQEAQA